MGLVTRDLIIPGGYLAFVRDSFRIKIYIKVHVAIRIFGGNYLEIGCKDSCRTSVKKIPGTYY